MLETACFAREKTIAPRGVALRGAERGGEEMVFVREFSL